MARSMFIFNDRRERAISAQFRRASDNLLCSGFALEGPYGDRNGALSQICEQARKRMQFGSVEGNPVWAAMVTMQPQNVPGSESSWLKEPFALTLGAADACTSAGGFASVEPVRLGDGLIRPIDLEGQAIVAAAIIRRLGVPAFLSYVHLDSRVESEPASVDSHGNIRIPLFNPMPAVVTLGEGEHVLTLLSPLPLERPFPRHVLALEILDDDALQALMMIKHSVMESYLLMRDMRSGDALTAEARVRAMAIGHALFEGISAWDAESAQDALEEAAELAGAQNAPERSMRQIVEDGPVHTLLCPIHHALEASSVILCANAKEIFRGLVSGLQEGDTGRLAESLASIPGHGCIELLYDYISASAGYSEHLHPRSGCGSMKGLN